MGHGDLNPTIPNERPKNQKRPLSIAGKRALKGWAGAEGSGSNSLHRPGAGGQAPNGAVQADDLGDGSGDPSGSGVECNACSTYRGGGAGSAAVQEREDGSAPTQVRR